MKDPAAAAVQHFDFTGFAALGLALGALQLMLDRGEFKDWFGSMEIIVYAVLCGLGFYLFLVHTLTADEPLIPPRIFRDVNFVLRSADDLRGRHVDPGDRGTAPPYLQTLGRLFGGRRRICCWRRAAPAPWSA